MDIAKGVAIRLPLKLYLQGTATDATGKTVPVTISKNGAAFGNPNAGATNATEIASGWYYFDADTTDTGTAGPLIVRGTCAGCDNTEAAYNVKQDSNVKKNIALSNFEFVMTDSSTHAPTAGLTVTATRSIDGGAFAACTNAAAGVASGVYKIDLSAADLNGNVITLRFTAAGADDRLITIITQP